MRRYKSKGGGSCPQRKSPCARSSSTGADSDADLQDPAKRQEQLLDQIAEGAQLCRQIEAQLHEHPAPKSETIIQVYRVLLLKLSAELRAGPEMLALANALMKPVMDWERLEEKHKELELKKQKHQDQQAATAAARQKEQRGRDGALKPETLEKIEHELHLF